MLNDLALNTDVLLGVTDDFRPLQQELAFVNFIEGNRMGGVRRVVGLPSYHRLLPGIKLNLRHFLSWWTRATDGWTPRRSEKYRWKATT